MTVMLVDFVFYLSGMSSSYTAQVIKTTIVLYWSEICTVCQANQLNTIDTVHTAITLKCCLSLFIVNARPIVAG